MNIKNLHNSIIHLYSKSGRKSKEIRRELIAFICIKAISIINNTALTTDSFSKILSSIPFDEINVPNVQVIVTALNNHVTFKNNNELFNRISMLIDDISKIYNPKYGQHYTNQSMANLSANLLLKDVNVFELNKREEITIYEPSAGTGNLIFPLVDLLIEKGISKDKIKIYANEFDDEVAFILQMLLMIKGIRHEIKVGDTLVNYFIDEQNNLKKFDFVVSNPPFGVGFKADELKEHDLYSNYIVKNKLQIAKASNSLFVFMEIIRNSYTVSALVIGNDCSFEKSYKNGAYQNSVLGNIVKDAQLDTLIMQPSSMFVNTDITTNIMLLSNNNSELAFIDVDTSYMYEKNMYSVSKMKNGYSQKNIDDITEYAKSDNKVEYNKTTLLDMYKLNEAFRTQNKETLLIIEQIKNDFEHSLDMLSMQYEILTMAISNENVLKKICEKHGVDIDYMSELIDGKSEASQELFINSIKTQYNLNEVIFQERTKSNAYKFLVDGCILELENITNTKENLSSISSIHTDVQKYNDYMANQTLALENILGISTKEETIGMNIDTADISKAFLSIEKNITKDTSLLDFM